MVDVCFDRTRDTDPDTDAVVDDGVNQTCCHTLMSLLNRIAHDQGASWEAHIHTPRDNDCHHESLGPVDLMWGHRCCKDTADRERAHRNEHDPARADP